MRKNWNVQEKRIKKKRNEDRKRGIERLSESETITPFKSIGSAIHWIEKRGHERKRRKERD